MLINMCLKCRVPAQSPKAHLLKKYSYRHNDIINNHFGLLTKIVAVQSDLARNSMHGT